VDPSTTLEGEVTAAGGAGGAGLGGVDGGAGGSATAMLRLTTSPGYYTTTVATSVATGGSGGTGAKAGAGGRATATTGVRSSGDVDEYAFAHGGVGGVAGTAIATTYFTKYGTFNAEADTGLVSGHLVQTISASVEGSVQGAGGARAIASIGGQASEITTFQALALADGAPTSAETAAVLAANSRIANAFGASPTFFAIDQLGGRYSKVGQQPEYDTATVNETIDLTQLVNRKDLILGFYNGEGFGSWSGYAELRVVADGITEVDQIFSSAASAQAFFTDKTLNLGSLAAGQPLGGDTLTLNVSLTVNLSYPNSGFSGSLIIGDPPATPQGAPPGVFAQAMAGFSAGVAVPLHASTEALCRVEPLSLIRPGMSHVVLA